MEEIMKDKVKQPKNLKWIMVVFFVLIGAACGAVIGFFGGKFVPDSASTGLEIAVLGGLLVGFYGIVFLQILLHEVGHLLFGLLSGYRFLSFRIGSLMWVKKEGKHVLYRFQLAGTAGQCLMAPPVDTEEEKPPYILYNLGGSLLNMLVAILSILGIVMFSLPVVLDVILYELAIVGIGFALMNGIPLRLGFLDNDGYNAISMGKNKDSLHAFQTQLRINELYLMGTRLNDMPKEWFYLPQENSKENSMVTGVGVFYCNRLMEAELFEEADRQMEELLALPNMIGIHRQLLRMDQLYCRIISESGEATSNASIDDLYDKKMIAILKAMKNNPSVLRTQYIYALFVEKDLLKAESYSKQFEKIAKSYPYELSIYSERALMERALKKSAQ